MECMNCGVSVMPGLDHCNRCGWNIAVQKKAMYLSKLYYNRGLEKAGIRDLSGAISCLKQSLKFYKGNIQARNLLGLVYFETGEVVSALSEWVISKNLSPRDNLAEIYIGKLQANPNKLENINQTIRKYNQALEYCREGHEDMAAIQLKKVLAQNPKLIKGYHLLALLQIREGSYTKARKTLRRAAKIDKTNTTTLRFLREVDLQTGMVTNLDKRERGRRQEEELDTHVAGYRFRSGNDTVIQPPAFKESSMWGTLVTLGIGIIVGVAAVWFLVIPDRTQKVQSSANKQILSYGDQLSTRDAKISELEAELESSQVSSNDTQQQSQEAAKKVTDYDNLAQAVNYFTEQNYEIAASLLAEVDKNSLSEQALPLYQTLRQNLAEYMPQEDVQGQEQQDGQAQDQLDGQAQDLTGMTQEGMDLGGMDDMGYAGEALY